LDEAKDMWGRNARGCSILQFLLHFAPLTKTRSVKKLIDHFIHSFVHSSAPELATVNSFSTLFFLWSNSLLLFCLCLCISWAFIFSNIAALLYWAYTVLFLFWHFSHLILTHPFFHQKYSRLCFSHLHPFNAITK